MLEYVKTVTGAGKITNKQTSNPHHAPGYCYAVHIRQALTLPGQTFPYLRSCKRLRSGLILDHYLELTPGNGKYSPELMQSKKAFEKEVLSLKASEVT